MRFFFRSRQFKIILSVVAAVLVITLIFGLAGSRMAPGADVIGSVTAPIRQAVTSVSGSVKDFFTALGDGNRLLLENAELKRQVTELEEKLSDFDSAKSQNEFYKDYLGIHDEHQDFVMTDAKLVSRDSDDPYGAFVINKGSLSGIHKHDPVITDAGLVGYVFEVGISTSKVKTVLSPDVTMGAIVSRTSDSGIISGELSLAKDKKTRLSNLSRSCSVAIGDFAVTSGEGIFPAGLAVGKVESIASDKYNTSIYAEIKPFVDFDELKGVMVITDFAGKGGIAVKDSK